MLIEVRMDFPLDEMEDRQYVQRDEREFDSYQTYGLARIDEPSPDKPARRFTCDYWRYDIRNFIEDYGERTEMWEEDDREWDDVKEPVTGSMSEMLLTQPPCRRVVLLGDCRSCTRAGSRPHYLSYVGSIEEQPPARIGQFLDPKYFR